MELLCKFRFGNHELIAQYFGKKDRSFVYKRLAILQELGLVGKRFESNYRLRGRPAAYYLLPEGARMLNQYRDPGEEINIKTIYKDAAASERFIDHCFAVFSLYMQLMEEYGDALDFLTKPEQTEENLPKQKPDAFLMLESDGDTHYYFVEVLDDDAHVLIDTSKKVKRYIEYKKSDSWAQVDQVSFPKIIFICSSEESTAKVRSRCEAILNKSWASAIDLEITTKENISLR